jgi:beta-galactosidase
VTTDFRRSIDDLSGYRLVIVPMQYLITDAGAGNIADFVRAGGTVVVTYFSGIVDENDHIRLGGYPGAFTELLGVRIEEFFPLRDAESEQLNAFGSGTLFSALGRSVGASVLAQYTTGPVAGSPAVTRNAFGGGAAYYVGANLETHGLDELLEGILEEAELVAVVDAGPDVEVVRRSDGERSWLFVINHSAAEARLTVAGVELISGDTVAGTLRVPAGRVAVVRENPQSVGVPGVGVGTGI